MAPPVSGISIPGRSAMRFAMRCCSASARVAWTWARAMSKLASRPSRLRRPSMSRLASVWWSVIWWFLSDEAEKVVSGRRALFGGDLFPERGLQMWQGGLDDDACCDLELFVCSGFVVFVPGAVQGLLFGWEGFDGAFEHGIRSGFECLLGYHLVASFCACVMASAWVGWSAMLGWLGLCTHQPAGYFTTRHFGCFEHGSSPGQSWWWSLIAGLLGVESVGAVDVVGFPPDAVLVGEGVVAMGDG